MTEGSLLSRLLKPVGAAFGLYLLVVLTLMAWWDHEPSQFSVQQLTTSVAEADGLKVVTGSYTTSAVIGLANTLMEKRGGYLSNDYFPPGVWMDNVPNWEFGVLVQLRDIARAYRIDFSRSQSQSQEDEALSEAEAKFFWDNSSWAFPQTEDEYRDGIKLFRNYLARLGAASPDAQFYARADNLQDWLGGVSTRLGSLSQQLSASVEKQHIDIESTVAEAEAEAAQPTKTVTTKTPWTKIDDIFYEARGQTWALLHLLRAMDRDFADILEKKNARVSMRQIIRELEDSQETLWSPVILNGEGLGLVANHSLVMASYVSRVNASIIDFRNLLAQG